MAKSKKIEAQLNATSSPGAGSCCAIDYEALRRVSKEIIDEYAVEPGRARKSVRISARIIENYFKEAETASGFKFFADEAVERGGTGRAPYPLEYFVGGFALCELSIYARAASVLKVPIKALEIQVEGYFDHRGNVGMGRSRGFDSIRYDVRIESSESEDKIRRLASFVDRSCPAYNSLRRGVKLIRRVLLNGRVLPSRGKSRH